jgi:hypothetical protein
VTLSNIRAHSAFAERLKGSRNSPGRTGAVLSSPQSAHLMTRDEARRIAVNIAKLPKLLGTAEKNRPPPSDAAVWMERRFNAKSLHGV